MAFLFILFVISLVAFIFLRQPQFGRLPSDEKLKRISSSANYRDGEFQNLQHTPSLTEGASYVKVMREFFFTKKERSKPVDTIPSIKTDLLTLDPNKDFLVWFGHSSYFMQLSGRKILVDPVFSGNASPVKFTTRSFKGSDIYTTDDMPVIDYLFLTHDHYDHLDHQTIARLRPKIKKIVTGLGVGDHLERWGYDSNIIFEKDWNETFELEEGFVVSTTPGRHFSGRMKKNTSLWMSFVLTTPRKKIFIGGDSGYDTHFAEIGKKYGPFDLVILENGQYNKYWKYIHMMPEEVIQAAEDLKAKRLLPVHWAKFSLSLHPWDEPIKRVYAEAKRKGMNLVHPLIGAALELDGQAESTRWWEEIR